MICFAKEARKYANTQIVDLLTLYYINHHNQNNHVSNSGEINVNTGESDSTH